MNDEGGCEARQVGEERKGERLPTLLHPHPRHSPSLFVSIWRKIFSVLFSGVDSSSGIFITDETIL